MFFDLFTVRHYSLLVLYSVLNIPTVITFFVFSCAENRDSFQIKFLLLTKIEKTLSWGKNFYVLHYGHPRRISKLQEWPPTLQNRHAPLSKNRNFYPLSHFYFGSNIWSMRFGKKLWSCLYLLPVSSDFIMGIKHNLTK
jgi:hypothetical protein